MNEQLIVIISISSLIKVAYLLINDIKISEKAL